MHSARKIANFLLKEAHAQGKGISPLQMIKLVYIAHGVMLANAGKPLISDVIEAWSYGPVMSDLYHSLKRYGNNPIAHPMKEVLKSDDFDDYEKALMQKVFNRCGTRGGMELSSLTHQKGTPWHKRWAQSGQNAVIPNAMIKEHYDELIENQSRDK